jgi:hypothetical protein
MTLFKTIAVAGALALTTAASAGAATLNYATTIDAQRGFLKPSNIPDTPARANPDNALGAPDGIFYSMGFGGTAVLGFGEAFYQDATVWEVTLQPGLGGDHDEAVDVFVGSSYLADSFDITSFTFVGTINNKLAQGGQTLSFSGGPFSYLALVDVTEGMFPDSSSFDGFDLDAVGVSPVPLPAGGLLLLTAIGGLAAARRRKAA